MTCSSNDAGMHIPLMLAYMYSTWAPSRVAKHRHPQCQSAITTITAIAPQSTVSDWFRNDELCSACHLLPGGSALETGTCAAGRNAVKPHVAKYGMDLVIGLLLFSWLSSWAGGGLYALFLEPATQCVYTLRAPLRCCREMFVAGVSVQSRRLMQSITALLSPSLGG